MKILLTIRDRDLLSSLSKLLDLHGYSVTTAFDGVSASEYALEDGYDLAILDGLTSRVDASRVLSLLRDNRIPTIVLSHRADDEKRLCGINLASSYLPYPFEPDELFSKIDSVLEKAGREIRLPYGSGELTVRNFVLNGSVPVTNEELDLLLNGAKSANRNAHVYAASLTRKLKSSGLCVSYFERKGFQVVKCDAQC